MQMSDKDKDRDRNKDREGERPEQEKKMEKEDQAAASNPPLDVVTVTAAAEAEATDEKQPPEPQPTAEGSVPSDADDSEIAAVDPNSTLAALSESRWEEMFERLLQFKDIHGHCLVPNRYKEDMQLGAWVVHQRKNYRNLQSGSSRTNTMTTERAKRLMDVGFEWTAKNPRHLMWEVRYAELKDFKAQYGHAQVPIGWEQNVQLANWVSTQRQEYKNLIKGKTSRLNERRVQLLDSIGFAWELQRGGRRRRLTVSSDAEHGEDEMPVSAAETKSPSEEGGTAPSASETALFPVEDPNSPPPTVGGRRRTTLKKKAIQAEPGASRCILPGVAVLGGGRGAQRPSTSRRRSAGSASSSGGGGSSGAVRADSPISGGDQPLSVNSNEALLRALGNTNHHYSQLSMMQQQGSYQAQQQQQNPLTHHLMLSSQQMMQSGQNPYFTMAGGGGGQYGMPSYGGGGENMASARGMDPPQHPASQGLVHAAAEMYQHPYGYTGGSESKESAGNQYWQAGQQASYWGGPGGPTTAAATAAAQHLQAAAALTAGMDESTLPDHLVPLASIARRMNMQGGGGGGGGGDYNAGVPGGYISANMMQMAAHPNFQQQPSNQFHSQAAVRRGRIGDPPADTPSDEGYGDASPFMINNKRRSEASSMNSPRKKPSTRE